MGTCMNLAHRSGDRHCTRGMWVPGIYTRTANATNCLTDRDALDVEDQVRVGGNVWWCALLAVCKVGGNGQSALATRSHASDTNVPALDDLANTKLEREWLALLVGCILLVHVIVHLYIKTYNQTPCRSSACQCIASQHGRPS